VAFSTLGTERTNKMPYSMQNLMGGKLDKRRQMEEAVIATVRQRAVEPALDFTICKLGELKASSDAFSLMSGDALDGTTTVDTAVTVLAQAMAFQPAARNATFACVGSLPSDCGQAFLDDSFLRLDGPEIIRMDLSEYPVVSFAQLAEYMREWAFLMAETGKGLTTPIRAEVSKLKSHTPGVVQQAGVQILFLPTTTGAKYMSSREERDRELERDKEAKSDGPRRTTAKEGGLEVLVEVTDDSRLRIRVKRCNYADGAVLKEMSEETIISRFKQSMEVWKKDHTQAS
jgi:hypothetical protein